ncbi:MAG: DUF1571 domain-containing protein, partial [Candidatus Binatia bacterium]
PTPSQDVIAVVFRKPAFLSLRWQEGLYEGTHLLSRPTWNRGNVLIRLGDWFDFITISVPSTEVSEPFVPGLKDMSEWLTALTALAQRPVSDRSLQLVKVRPGDPSTAEGRVVLAVPAFLIPFRADNVIAIYEFIIERGTGIPSELVLRDAAGQVHQRLTYTDLQVNIGVPSQVFSWEESVDEFRALPQAEVDVDLRGLSQHWQRRYAEITDYTGIWVTAGHWEGSIVSSRAAFKFRKPFDLYLDWTVEGGGAQEALFRQGWNEGRVRVRTTLLGIPLIGDLSLNGYLARQGLPYSPPEFGFHRLVERLQDQLLRGWLQGELGVRFYGVQEHEERPCYVLEFRFPTSQGREYAHSRVIVFWDIARRVPVRYEAFDRAGQLDEYHEFFQIQMNVSLSDIDFDAANPAYHFLLLRGVPQLDWFLSGRE